MPSSGSRVLIDQALNDGEELPVPVRLDAEDFPAEYVTVSKFTAIQKAIPGIGTGAAYAAGDQFGTKLEIDVPRAGTIVEFRFHDLDNEALDKEVYVLKEPPTLAADNAAFTLGDPQNLHIVGVLLVDTWQQIGNTATSQIGFTSQVPLSYVAPSGKLWLAFRTLGVDNIAAGSEPYVSLVVAQ